MMTIGTPASDRLIREAEVQTFNPLAFYNKHMDCIRIELRDCSTRERRVSPHLTMIYDNYPDAGQSPLVGLVIKGVKHFFIEWGIPLAGIQLVTELLDKIVKSPEFQLDPEVQNEIERLRETATSIEMMVNLSLAA